MNKLNSLRSFRSLLLFALVMGSLPLFAAGALAAEGPVVASSSLQANLILELVGDRSRMVQVSVVFVGFCIALLWWKG